jgi:TATA-box binding protein (TBP) (component of TFIID and TFIIIB)
MTTEKKAEIKVRIVIGIRECTKTINLSRANYELECKNAQTAFESEKMRITAARNNQHEQGKSIVRTVELLKYLNPTMDASPTLAAVREEVVNSGKFWAVMNVDL